MKQLSLPGLSENKQRIVNVASVRHRSPFRYPGGKTWLVPQIQHWLSAYESTPAHFIEPFAGGGIVGLTIAFEDLAGHVTLVERDEQVAAVWETIIVAGKGELLAEKIISFELTPTNVDSLLAKDTGDLVERAFQTIIKNRINRGGILAAGAGKIKTGENGQGIASRWYPETLKQRILDIHRLRNQLSFIWGDGLSVIQENSACADTVFFIDPPYTASDKRPGSRLYNYSEIDHAALFDLMAGIKGDFLMSYDNHQTVIDLARAHHFDIEPVAMKNTHHNRLTELLIGQNLDWLRV